MRKLIDDFYKAVVLQDENLLKNYFNEDAKILWHCTNERLMLDEYIKANCEYPGIWYHELIDVFQADDKVIAIARIYSDQMSCHVTSIFTFINNKIIHLDEYFADNGMPPLWRLNMHLGKPIK